ncbi:DUF4145 domain-containing protein [Edwardsiella tarda]|uniref:DUF4145 domain-containing protein n=1 Tax=Edwardsiella tarda TaxID=636 RepID=UPI0008FF8AB8|nr:DUF4145 domain-containing protein [Edwardsiella tarda]UBU95283.1 DUF4145 domain-containing protein [Edwardsiella tarda]
MSRVTWEKPKIEIHDNIFESIGCHVCKTITNHKKLVEVNLISTLHADDEYHNSISYYKDVGIFQCQGCMDYLLKVETCNSDSIDYDTYEPDVSVDFYPKRNQLSPFEYTHLLPAALRDIYDETISAINSECLTIAGIGIRGLIETICNEEGVKGRTLEEKINTLFNDGKISADSKVILHSLRTLYNKSAHESFKPSLEQLKLSLDIMELLMKQIYVHSYKARECLQSGT